ncbi:ACP S-malonyltransferase [Aliikangiella maris]|uniref:[acyl-carrier-protein] S-malonyltransferase n=2 Tax=Aliikangiella maris TaxID=3162458 RepID=A0ABV2BU16_9GAMM
MKIFMFPGQGSQTVGMGGDLFDRYPEYTAQADEVLGYSIKTLCLADPQKQLNFTQFTQPALYVVNALNYFDKVAQGIKADYLIGHSLGEFNALMAAQSFSFEDGLKLVKKRGELMSQAKEGGMAAIINASKEKIETILKDNQLSNIDLANFNTPSQIVISGKKEEIIQAQNCFSEDKMLYIPLNTSGAFHSRFMAEAKDEFAEYLKPFNIQPPITKVISNVTAKTYGDDVATSLAAQIASAVRWSETIEYLIGLGDAEFIEVGHGDVLTKMILKIKRETTVKPGSVSAEPTELVTDSSTTDDAVGSIFAKQFSQVHEKVEQWNKVYPVGTKVKSTWVDATNLQTRTEAVVLFGHRAAVYMKDYNGYFDLDELIPQQSL